MNRSALISLALLALLALASMGADTARAQNIPRDEYLRYMPLDYPKLVRQTEASERLQLYGDPSAPGYVDQDPRDGIDDRRNRVFEALGVRFAPFMLLNTTAVPMDFGRFMDDRASFPLYVDTWKLGGPSSELVSTQTVDWANLGNGPEGTPTSDDRRLLDLLADFRPVDPQDPYYGESAVRPEDESFKVLFFDFPGEGPESWQREYDDVISAQLPLRYRSFLKNYVHPFVHEKKTHTGETVGYELVLQYWFFYPFNDGGNNHEGDWEHINVVVAPLSRVGELLDEPSLMRILDGQHEPDAADDPLVIRRIDYYFHNKVWPLDFSVPNAYASEEDWKAEVKGLPEERVGVDKVWKHIRQRAWFDEDAGVINTHPICLIGADNKGLDAAITSPGSKNRDSHGTYPFAGLYKDIGPGGATEALKQGFDHQKWYREGNYQGDAESEELKRGEMVRFDRLDRIQVVPDWERVAPLVYAEPELRASWAWMLLPIRWGYPASESPFAGVISHAETGNLAPVGPSYSLGWNVSQAARSFALYKPHRFNSHFPLGVQDNFHNSWGYFNLTLPVILMLPPVDFVDRILLAPLRLISKPSPTYFPTESVPIRFVGAEYGFSAIEFDEDWALLFFNEDQTEELVLRLVLVDPGVIESNPISQVIHPNGIGDQFTVAFFMGKGFVSENTVRHSRSTLGFDIGVATQSDPFHVEGELNFWEYAGSLRYNFGDHTFLPYAELGYGNSWYRLENVKSTVPGGAIEPLENPNSPWVRKPDLWKWENIWPNTFHFGLGMEWLIIQSNAPLLRGTDLSVRGELSLYHHNLGFNDIRVDGLSVNESGTDLTIWRMVGFLGLMLSF